MMRLPGNQFIAQVTQPVDINSIHILSRDIQAGDADIVQCEPEMRWALLVKQTEEEMVEKTLMADEGNNLVSVAMFTGQV